MNSDAQPTSDFEQYPDEDGAFASLYDSRPFETFEQEMDECLEWLVRRWSHLAAPKAGTVRLRTFNLGHPKKAK